MSITSAISEIIATLPKSVTLVAVSKNHSNEMILEAYNAGQRIFGESHAIELKQKAKSLPDDISWHFIGHLQSNKVREIADYVDVIHSIDSLKLLTKINEEAKKLNRTIKCLIQIHIAQEEQKFGLNINDVSLFFQSLATMELSNVEIIGLMGIATNTDDKGVILNEFENLKNIFEKIKNEYMSKNQKFSEISIGMSDDYPIALEKGSTMVRIGSKIFGAREY